MPLFKNTLIFIAGILIFHSCTGERKKNIQKNDNIQVQVVFRMPYDTLKDNTASFIAGKDFDYKGCLSFLDTLQLWKRYKFTMDSGFTFLDTSRFVKMSEWADKEISHRKDTVTLFYPFGGPDFLNANIFYPEASKYILFGLEPAGTLPDVCSLNMEQIKEYTESVWLSLRDLFLRSYFITGHMMEAIKKSEVNGSAPIIAMFIKRRGYNIVSVRNIGIDSTGRCIYTDSVKKGKIFARGIKFDFAGDTGHRIQSVLYFRVDVSDAGLKQNYPFMEYLKSMPYCNTYLKAGSYLMHSNEFSGIRNLVLDKSISILQDDSGIAYKYFDKKVWNIKLYGKYTRPGKEFSWINEMDLAEAYRDTSIKPVPFTLGYNWRTRAINLLYAVKK